MTCHLHVVFVLNSPVMYFVPGFEITIEHPHTDVVKCTQLVRGRGFLLCSSCPLILFVPPQPCWFNGYTNTPCPVDGPLSVENVQKCVFFFPALVRGCLKRVRERDLNCCAGKKL